MYEAASSCLFVVVRLDSIPEVKIGRIICVCVCVICGSSIVLFPIGLCVLPEIWHHASFIQGWLFALITCQAKLLSS